MRACGEYAHPRVHVPAPNVPDGRGCEPRNVDELAPFGCVTACGRRCSDESRSGSIVARGSLPNQAFPGVAAAGHQPSDGRKRRGRLEPLRRQAGFRAGRRLQRLPPKPALKSSRTRTPPMPSWDGPKNAPVTSSRVAAGLDERVAAHRDPVAQPAIAPSRAAPRRSRGRWRTSVRAR